MKFVLIAIVSVMSLAAFADKFDGDVNDIYISWCDQQNVVTNGQNNTSTILVNCAAQQQICVLDQKTSGKNVYYRAFCEDRPVKNGRE